MAKPMYLNPELGDHTDKSCRYLLARAQVIDDIDAYLDVENPMVPKLYLFPKPAQSDEACLAVCATLNAVIANTLCFIVRLQPLPMNDQLPMLLRLQGE